MQEPTHRYSPSQTRPRFAMQAPATEWARWPRALVNELLGLTGLYKLRDEARGIQDPFELAAFALRGLKVSIELPAKDLERVPSSGPLIVVANHPYGALDGLSAIAALAQRRRDLRVLANPELRQIEQLRSLILPLDPYGKVAARRENAKSLRHALRWLENGHTLLIFPAGEVAHFDWRTGSVTDPQWNTTAARLARISKAQVTPMYFAGGNGALFNIAGLFHPVLRTLLLPRELAKRAGTTLRVRMGDALDPKAISAFESEETLTSHLRLKTYLLGTGSDTAPDQPKIEKRSPSPQSREELIAPIDPQLLENEIAALPADCLLLTSGAQKVFCASARQMPHVLQEIGRLRELTFRAVGEGTGRSADIDVFDDYYEHLFIWHAARREIVGAYRLGRVDEIRRRFGARGLYTSTLFEFREPFLALLGAALELGRSFVRPGYQKSFGALLLLWRGIGEYIGRHPRYARLIGPVSISNEYCSVSKELLVHYLRKRNFDHFGAALVRARNPFPHSASLRSLGSELNLLENLDALSALVTDLEPDRKGVPVLVRQYVKLGGRMLGFNVDAAFGHSIDCLILVDLRQTDTHVLRKYLSEEALKRFRSTHRLSYGSNPSVRPGNPATSK